MAKDRILVDLNSVAHAAHQGTILKSGDQETQAVFGTLRTMRALKVRHPDASIIGLWDGKSWRKELSDVYKANRTDDAKKRESRERFKTQTPYIRRMLTRLAMPQLFAINLEADDLASILAQRYTAAGDFVRLVTGDRDWIQLVGPNCIWEDHRADERRVTASSFKTATGFDTPLQYVQSKALEGDISDNLPGVGGIGEKGSVKLIGVWGRVEAFLADPDPKSTWENSPSRPSNEKTGKPESYPKAFDRFHKDEDGRHAKFYHNLHLMNLLGELPAPERMSLVKGEFDPDDFRTLCHELAFSSIYREKAFETFIQPFSGDTPPWV